MFYVYILHWTNGRYYVWYTWNLERRLNEHLRWNTKSTRWMWDKQLEWYFIKQTKTEAILLEKQIKNSWHISRWLKHKDFKIDMGY